MEHLLQYIQKNDLDSLFNSISTFMGYLMPDTPF